MTGQNVDIFNPEWLNVVFEGRNQAYGAYQLRKNNTRNTNRALLISLSLFLVAMGTPTLIKKLSGSPANVPVIQEHKTIVDLTKVYKMVIPPKPQAQPAAAHPHTAPPVNNVIIDKPPVVVPQSVQQTPTEIEVAKADPGQTNITGTHAGPPSVGTTPGPASTGGEGVHGTDATGDGNSVILVAEVSPEYPGGEAAFGRFLQKNIHYPQMAKEAGVQGKAYLQFIVERDGSLTDIRIIRNPGSGTGEEAARVLKMSPHWRPGMQNGTAVRVQYTVPVNFTLGDQN